MSETISARLHGGDRQGQIVKFKIVDALPTPGDLVDIGDVWTWGSSTPARLDPEQRTGEDHRHAAYDFYETEELNGDGEVSEIHYFAVANGTEVRL